MNEQLAIAEQSSPSADALDRAALCLTLHGQVQGLGVRPAVFRLASDLQLAGTVRNTLQGLQIEIEGDADCVEQFVSRLPGEIPQAARIDRLEQRRSPPQGLRQFRIVREQSKGPLRATVPTDRAVCSNCLTDVERIRNRRYGYAFTSCTNCGPRYSLIRAMPYERPDTAMAAFDLCERCFAEDITPADRRFHAQTNACPQCGPTVWCVDGTGRSLGRGDKAIETASTALRQGRIVAVKGVGGYQLLVDATNEAAVCRLRERKRRPAKPLAVMVDSLATAEKLAHVEAAERSALIDASNPIVLLRARSDSILAPSIHPALDTVGLLLPTTPLHWLLLQSARSLVCTSGNREGDPLEFIPGAAQENLNGICDLWLHHDREILRPIDDSVVRVIAGSPVTIRLARGLAPLSLELPPCEPAIATGGHLKTALAWSNGEQAVLGPHIGDLQTLAARQRFLDQIAAAKQLYRFEAARVVHDLHPDYYTSRWAMEQSLPTMPVQHHHAHVVSGMLEHGWLNRTVLGVAWDGTGYGIDGTIWGGEFLLATANKFERLAQLRPFALPGGEAAIREPWRTAVSVLHQALGSVSARECEFVGVDANRFRQVEQIIGNRNFSPVTTSAGRLFDAAAAIILGKHHADYDGQPAMLLEAVADQTASGQYNMPLTESAPFVLDWRPVFAELLDDLKRGLPAPTLAMRFHRSLAAGILSVCRLRPELPVVLSGGVFQNRLLTELIVEMWPDDGPALGLPGVIPPNDGGLAAGQLAVAAMTPMRKG